MQLTAAIFLGLCLQVSAAGIGQTVTVKGTNMPLETVITSLEKQTGLLFIYTSQEVQKGRSVTIDVKNVPVKDFLELVFDDQPLEFSIKGTTVFIREKVVLAGTDLSRRLSLLLPPPITVRGRIVNEKGEPVVASVLIEETKRGATSDTEGFFELKNVEANSRLIISATNIETLIVFLDGKKSLDIRVKMTSSSLNEVIVNKGYYKEKQRLSTGNVTKITSKDIERQPVTSPLLALQGRVAGLEVIPASGAPGGAPKIKIRGENNLFVSTTKRESFPLYVIDGVMIESTPLEPSLNPVIGVRQTSLYSNGIDPLANINPENIESIEVLKDADATAIYGSRGANGVIIVTTKQARGNNNNINISFYKGIGRIPEKLDLLNTAQYLEMRNEAFRNTGSAPSEFDFDLTKWDSTADTDWQKKLVGKSSKITDIQVGYSGGSPTTSFRLGAEYHKETTIASDDFGYNRSGVNFNLNHHSVNQKLNISFSANYGISTNRSFNLSNLLGKSLTLPPNAPANLFLEDGSLNFEIIDYGTFKLASFDNPMVEFLRAEESKVGTLIGNSVISYEFIKNTGVKVNFGYTDTYSDGISKEPIAVNPPTVIGSYSKGAVNFVTNRRNSWIIEPQFFFKKQYGNHMIDFLIGSTVQGGVNKYQSILATGYGSDALLTSLLGATDYSYTADDNNEYRFTSGLSRLGYNFSDKYLINLTARRDGSSRFGPGNKFGNFGAVGAAWIFSNEKIVEQLGFLSFGKLRTSYGITGSDQIGDYKYYDLYRINTRDYQGTTTLLPDGLFNEDFGWEKTKKLEVAVDLGFLNDRISAQAVWYRNLSSNQLIDYQLPYTTGFSSFVTNFPAVVENKGWEFAVSGQNITNKNFQWYTSFNLTIPKGKLKSFNGIENTPYKNKYKIGEPLSIILRYTYTGIDPQTGVYTVADLNNDGAYDDVNDVMLGGSISSKYYAGINNRIIIGNFDISLFVQYNKQTSRNILFSELPGAFRSNQPIKVLNRWQKPGDNTTFGKYSTSYLDVNEFSKVLNSDFTLVDASFLKLKTLSLSYNLPVYLLDNLKIKGGQVFLQGQNILTITDFIGLDPETGARNLPQLRMITAGIQVKF